MIEHRPHLRLICVLALILATIALVPHPAAAADVFDPSSNVKDLVEKFYPTAQAWAFRLYTLLLFMELFALAVTTILFRENIGEFIGGIAMKVLIGSVFMYFVSNGQGFFQQVIDGFSKAGMQAGGSNAGTPMELVTGGFAASALFFGAAEAAHGADAFFDNLPPANACAGALTAITCLIGTSASFANAHLVFEMITSMLALLVALAFSGILCQVVLITIESYIVMFAGVFFIGFAGSRFTMPFSQGYFHYMISVGVKLFATYLIAGVVSTMLPTIITSAAASLAAACCLPQGYGTAVGLFPAAIGAFESLIAAALIWSIPNYAAAFISGQSSASSTAMLGQMTSSLSGIGQLGMLARQMTQHQKAPPKEPGGTEKGTQHNEHKQDLAPSKSASTDHLAEAANSNANGFNPLSLQSPNNSSNGALGNLGVNSRPGGILTPPGSILNGPRMLPARSYSPTGLTESEESTWK